MNTRHCGKKKTWHKTLVNALTIISSVVTIAAAISIKVWSDGVRISLELAQNKSGPTVIVLAPTPQPLPTFTATPANSEISIQPPLPTSIPTPTVTPAPTLDLTERTHTVRSGEIMACIAKLYFDFSDALDELCEYNYAHPNSALFGKQSCREIYPGDTIIIPRSLFAVVAVATPVKETLILKANEIEQPDNAYLCQNTP